LPIAGAAICGILLIPPLFTLLAASALFSVAHEAAKTPRDFGSRQEAPDVNSSRKAKVTSARETTIGELVDAYDRNEISAAAKYGKQPLKVTGTFGDRTIRGWSLADRSGRTITIDFVKFPPKIWSTDLTNIEATVIGECGVDRDGSGHCWAMLFVVDILPSREEFLSAVQRRREAESQAKEKQIEERIAHGPADTVFTKSESWNEYQEALGKCKESMVVEARCVLLAMEEEKDGRIMLKLDTGIGGNPLETHFDPKHKSQIMTLSKGQMIVVRGKVGKSIYRTALESCVLVTDGKDNSKQ
jgi:hypothetical protein